jgi:hypothetical protein
MAEKKSFTPSAKCRPQLIQLCVFLESRAPSRHFNWRAEGVGDAIRILDLFQLCSSAKGDPGRRANFRNPARLCSGSGRRANLRNPGRHSNLVSVSCLLAPLDLEFGSWNFAFPLGGVPMRSGTIIPNRKYGLML